MTTFVALAALARSSPAINASYSTSLLVVGKSRQTLHSTVSSSGDSSTTPAPPAYLLDDPSVCILHKGDSFAPFVLIVGKFCYEVHDDLSFDGGPWAILDVKLAQLYSP